MNEVQKTIETYSVLSNMELSDREQQEIWDNIEKEIDQMKPIRTKRRSNLWGTGAAAAAAIVVVVGGYYAFSNHSINHLGNQRANQSFTTASQNQFNVPPATSIQSANIKNTGANDTWVTSDPKSVAKQVMNWLDTATVTSNGQFQRTAGTATQLDMTTSTGTQITIFPAKAVDGSPAPNVVVYQTGNSMTYLTAPLLYNWLINGGWKSEFAPKTNTQTASSYSPSQLAALTAQQLASYNIQHQQALPFAGSNVTRSVPKQQLLVSDPKSGSMNPPSNIKGTTTLNPNNFYVIDRWSLTIPGNNSGIVIEVDKKTDGSQYLIGIGNGPRTTAYSFNKQPYITNFTGSYIVFSTPNPAQGNPFYAINVQTGALVTGQTAYQMSTDYGKMGGASGDIQGLPQPFSSLPE